MSTEVSGEKKKTSNVDCFLIWQFICMGRSLQTFEIEIEYATFRMSQNGTVYK